MRLVSSTLTLFFKIFIPTFWIAFFGIMVAALLVAGADNIPLFASWPFRIGAVLFYALGIGALYYFFLRLKRVEMDSDYFYVSNYFKTYRYPYTNIARVDEENILGFKKIRIHLAQPGSVGKTIVFIASRKRWREFIKEEPQVFAHLN